MNDTTLAQLKDIVHDVVGPISASPVRKRKIEEEMLLHLSECYQHELQKIGDETAAMVAACERFGDAQETRRQLQASVPLFERAYFTYINDRETAMSKVLWIVSVVAIVVGMNFAFPYRDEVHLGGVALLSVMIIRHLFQPENLAARWLGPQWRWLVGIFGIAFGPALILPALAKIARDHIYAPPFFIALGIGILITLSGFGFVVLAISRRRTEIA